MEKLIAELVRSLPPLNGLHSAHCLVVAASAHGGAAASIRSLDAVASRVEIAGKRRRYELALRPLFFLEGDVASRLTTLVHELLHLDPAHPGKLLAENRHPQKAQHDLQSEASALAQAFVGKRKSQALWALGHHGDVAMRQWKVRPISRTKKRVFDDDDVFVGSVPMLTAPKRRTVWW